MSFENPLSILFDSNGNELAVSASQLLDVSGAQAGILLAGSGSDGKVRFARVSDTGEIFVTGSVAISTAGQGNHGTADQSWYMVLTDGTSSAALGSAEGTPLYISGTVATNGPDGTSIDPIFITGSIGLADQPITVTGSVTVNSIGAPVTVDSITNPVTVTGSVGIVFNPNPTATVAAVASSATVVTLLAANANRRSATFYHNGNKKLYLKLGAAASLSSFSVILSAQGYYEIPGNYTGIVTGIWDSVAGNVLVTEIVE